MNRIAILADIHGNIPALEAVIADVQRQDVDQVWVGGDMVGRGPQGSAVVHRILELGWSSVRGNHEDYLLSFLKKKVPKSWLTQNVWAASRWMADELDPEAIDFLDTLPFTITPDTEGPFRLFHGSPKSHNDGIGVWTSDETCLEYLNGLEESAMACGHTHRPMLREFPEGVIVNVGSVGLPFNGDWRAQYAILHRDNVSSPWTAIFRQIDYEREHFLGIYNSTGFLAKGHITAHLLKMEVQTARPYLVPFLKWVEKKEIEPTYANLDPFLERFDPTLPMSQLLKQLEGEG